MVGGYFSLPFLHNGRLSCCSAARATTTKKLNWQLDWMGLDGSNGGDFFIQKYGGVGGLLSHACFTAGTHLKVLHTILYSTSTLSPRVRVGRSKYLGQAWYYREVSGTYK